MSLRSIARGLKLRFGNNAPWMLYMPRGGERDYARDVGDGTNSSVVVPALMWVARTFPEAPITVRRRRPDGQSDEVVGHQMAELIRRPNPYYTGKVLWMATIVDYNADGNAYWIIVRDNVGKPRELWWAPHWTMTPVGSDEEYLTRYEYRPGGVTGAGVVNYSPRDVLHFRFGLDPTDIRKGRSPLKAVLREVYTDEEAARFTAALLRNMGVPGIIISPESGDYSPTPEEAEELKADMKAKFTGQRRGEPMVLSGPTKVAQFGFSPEQMNLRDLRRLPEERVTAALGVPAVVAGLGAGLDRSTFTNMAEAREMAYESNIIPSQAVMAEDLRHQLLPEFQVKPELFEVGFDLSNVRVLQEDQLKRAQRWNTMLASGGVMVSEYRRDLGLPVTKDHDVFLRPVNLQAVLPDGTPLNPTPPGAGTLASAAGGASDAATALVEALQGGGNGSGNGGGT